ncbi:MAG: aldolase/citrate lyase family protein, partial [Minwuia sp.]|nr:aldolase/citrate lyase family protein [Minwuia sp.]
MMHLMLIPESLEMARAAHDAGVDRLFLDLERAGKQARQGSGTWISTQSMADIGRYRDAFPDTHILVRTDPWPDLGPEQLAGVLAAGVQQVMLPMIRSTADVAAMCDALAGRLPLVPLIETVASAEALKQIAALDGVQSVYFGLNDLHL